MGVRLGVCLAFCRQAPRRTPSLQRQAQPGVGNGKPGRPSCRGLTPTDLHIPATPRRRSRTTCGPPGLGALQRPHTGAAGGAACGDLVRVSVEAADDRVAAAGFDASAAPPRGRRAAPWWSWWRARRAGAAG